MSRHLRPEREGQDHGFRASVGVEQAVEGRQRERRIRATIERGGIYSLLLETDPRGCHDGSPLRAGAQSGVTALTLSEFRVPFRDVALGLAVAVLVQNS